MRGRYFSRGSYGFVIYNKNLAQFFNELGFPFGEKSTTVSIPLSILNSNNSVFYARFLRGLFDTDGHLGFRKCYGKYNEFKTSHHHYPLINIATVSNELAHQICTILSKLDINYFLSGYRPKKLSESYRYFITINGVDRLLKWMKVIGSKNPVKFSRFQIWRKFGFCPTHTTLKQRKDILSGKLDIYNIMGS